MSEATTNAGQAGATRDGDGAVTAASVAQASGRWGDRCATVASISSSGKAPPTWTRTPSTIAIPAASSSSVPTRRCSRSPLRTLEM